MFSIHISFSFYIFLDAKSNSLFTLLNKTIFNSKHLRRKTLILCEIPNKFLMINEHFTKRFSQFKKKKKVNHIYLEILIVLRTTTRMICVLKTTYTVHED